MVRIVCVLPPMDSLVFDVYMPLYPYRASWGRHHLS